MYYAGIPILGPLLTISSVPNQTRLERRRSIQVGGPLHYLQTPPRGMLPTETDIRCVGAEPAAQIFTGSIFGSSTSPENFLLNHTGSSSSNLIQHDLSARFMRMISAGDIDPYEFIASNARRWAPRSGSLTGAPQRLES
ncbi:hypothetical protein R3P38DRAFT_3195954 [Favolaschia claudopus]|uniref:Uncharacterized protein n=1 Tax=Favolaschia claudopus TaxID=2862362 RepID=A0AAW0BAI1_9AGAR